MIVQRFFRFLLYSNSWVALSFASLVFGISHFYSLPKTGLYSTIAFTGTLSAYQLHRFLRIHQYRDHKSTNVRSTWMLNNKWLLRTLFVISTAYTLIIGFQFIENAVQLWLIAISAIIVGLYALPLQKSILGIRQLPFVKNFSISLVWIIGATLPYWSAHSAPDIWLLLVLFFATFIQIIPFDIRDLPVDSTQMHTIPQLLGEFGSRLFASSIAIGITLILSLEIGFHPMLLLYLFTALFGYWINITLKNLLFLEFIWELPLLVLGLFFANMFS